jgi:hypothetical protein
MTREDAILWNTIREIFGQRPIPQTGRNKGFRVREDRQDIRFIQNLAQFEGDGNRRVSTKKRQP